MLTDTLKNISDLLGISYDIIPNIITFMIVVVILFISLRSQLSFLALATVYFISMGVLTVLGIDSVFNLITLVSNAVDSVIDEGIDIIF